MASAAHSDISQLDTADLSALAALPADGSNARYSDSDSWAQWEEFAYISGIDPRINPPMSAVRQLARSFSDVVLQSRLPALGLFGLRSFSSIPGGAGSGGTDTVQLYDQLYADLRGGDASEEERIRVKERTVAVADMWTDTTVAAAAALSVAATCGSLESPLIEGPIMASSVIFRGFAPAAVASNEYESRNVFGGRDSASSDALPSTCCIMTSGVGVRTRSGGVAKGQGRRGSDIPQRTDAPILPQPPPAPKRAQLPPLPPAPFDTFEADWQKATKAFGTDCSTAAGSEGIRALLSGW